MTYYRYLPSRTSFLLVTLFCFLTLTSQAFSWTSEIPIPLANPPKGEAKMKNDFSNTPDVPLKMHGIQEVSSDENEIPDETFVILDEPDEQIQETTENVYHQPFAIEEESSDIAETPETIATAESETDVCLPVEKAESTTPTEVSEASETSKALFRTDRLNVLVIIIGLLFFVSYYTFQAQKGKKLFVRRISGLSALDDAVGRATEMGRGVLYIPGIMDMSDIQTIAGVTIMGHVAKKTAEYDTPFFAPMSRSFVMSVAQEVVKQSYLEMGRADAFRPDRINYLTDDQFGFVAGVGGLMLREKPAACFFLGNFYAESLILAETGNQVGAIQIAGTAEPSQIPFFVAACDYTLIGEELFAASAYLSNNPREIGSLKGQDASKAVIILIIIIGTLLVTVSNTKYGADTVVQTLADSFMQLFK